MRKSNITSNQNGFSIIEVLASFIIISILFTIISAYFVSSYRQSNSISNKYSAIQLAESLLNTYKKMSFSDLTAKVGTSEQIDIRNQLQIDPAFDIGSFSAKVNFQKHPDPLLQDRLIDIQVTVTSQENGVKKETSLEGYKRNEEN
ncbi:prepilin-type N-terminal cleavage/methylation domain-containing protein [Bacillota bacterium Lsc_1132]